MKVFDFSNGKKGKLLDNVRLVEWCGNNGGIRPDFGRYSFHVAAGWGGGDSTTYLDPKKYGVDAICFCIGSFMASPGEEMWDWECVGSVEWAKKIAKSYEAYDLAI